MTVATVGLIVERCCQMIGAFPLTALLSPYGIRIIIVGRTVKGKIVGHRLFIGTRTNYLMSYHSNGDFWGPFRGEEVAQRKWILYLLGQQTDTIARTANQP